MGNRLAVTELAVDNLEWHAERARAMADTARQADDLQAHAAAAASRGDRVVAAEHAARAAMLRNEVDALALVREHPPYPLDHAALRDIGVDVAPGDLAAPLPELMDPNALTMGAVAGEPADDADGIAAAAS